MKCVLVGNYGVGNIGDEALREYFLRMMPEVEWISVSGGTGVRKYGSAEVPRLPLGLRSLFHPWWRTIRAIAQADALVFGGGSLFTDIESVWACVIWWAYAATARLFGTPIVLAFQGAGPYGTRLGKYLARWTYERASFISVRDEASLTRLRSWALKCTPVLTFDPAFALFAAHPKKSSAASSLVIIPRTNSDETFFAAVKDKVGGGKPVRILLMQPDAAERQVASVIAKLCKGQATIIEILSVTQLLDEVAGASDVLSQRYHGALAALAMRIPVDVVPQGAGDKMAILKSDFLRNPGLREQWLGSIEAGKVALRDSLKSLSSSI